MLPDIHVSLENISLNAKAEKKFGGIFETLVAFPNLLDIMKT